LLKGNWRTNEVTKYSWSVGTVNLAV